MHSVILHAVLIPDKHSHLFMAGVRVVTDILWEHRTNQHLDLNRINVGGPAWVPLLHPNLMRHLEIK